MLFELPELSLQLDLAILDDDARVVVLGEAKRDTAALSVLRRGVLERFSSDAPGPQTKRRRDEQRQLAWRVWTVAPRFTWLIGPGHREAFATELNPLRLTSLPHLPTAASLGLQRPPARRLAPPDLAS